MRSISTHTHRSFLRFGWKSIGAARLAAALALSLLASCRDNPVAPDVDNPDWTEASHGKVKPSYDVVFPQDAVNTVEIVMTAAQWSSIRQNMQSLWGFDFGAGDGRPYDPPTMDPAYTDVTFRFNGKVWKHVGFRLKGKYSLYDAWGAGNYKLPFRLQFDEFEDQYPAINDQRFYGFKELTMAPGAFDDSLIREKVTADIFRRAGIPAARTAFYRVYIDFGEGLKYAGVYTMVEVIDDTMVKDQFGEDKGNIYKPESTFQTFVKSEFEKKNNKAAANYSDVRAMITALNSDLRTRNPARWRANLEAVFNVDHFLKYLAVNNAIVNWDTYGVIAHNYYLYNHSRKKLTWIPWDHSWALGESYGITGPETGRGEEPIGISLAMNEVDSSWPLIRYLADDPVYYERYRAHMRAFYNSVFTQADMDALFDRNHAMISPYVIGENGEQPGYTHLSSSDAFTNSLAELKTHAASRRMLIEDFLR